MLLQVPARADPVPSLLFCSLAYALSNAAADTGPHIKTAIPETRPRLAFTSRTTFPSSSGAAPAPTRPPYEVGKAADTDTTRPALGPQAQAGVSRV
jgi:hypothetical protein